MAGFSEYARHPLCNLLVDYADALDQLPRKGLLDQELGLLSFFHERVSPIRLADSVPVKRIDLIDIIEETSSERRHFCCRTPNASRWNPPIRRPCAGPLRDAQSDVDRHGTSNPRDCPYAARKA